MEIVAAGTRPRRSVGGIAGGSLAVVKHFSCFKVVHLTATFVVALECYGISARLWECKRARRVSTVIDTTLGLSDCDVDVLSRQRSPIICSAV